MTTAPFTPDVDAIAADLQKGPVHVDPSMTDQLSADQLAPIISSIEDSPIPIHVIAVPLTVQSELSAVQLVALVHREVPQDGIWYVTRPSYDGTWRVEGTSYGVVTDNAEALATYVASDLYPADLALQLQKIVELISSGTAREAYDKTSSDGRGGGSSTTQGDGAQVLGVDLPIAFTGLGVLAVVVAIVALRRRPRSKDEIVVKNRALQRISTAQTDSWRHRAEEETEKLGDRINALEIGDDSDRSAWQAALDHYEAANRVLDRTTEAAHSIGALVLARRGEDALTHAVEGRAWSPQSACFFNPLHGAGTTTARWHTTAGTRDVPACNACRRDVRKRREPDFLDLPINGTVVHYVDADESAEPWASTGYGSLRTDLLARVREI